MHGGVMEQAADEIERLRKENFALAAYQCHTPSGDEYGNMKCLEIERLRTANASLTSFIETELNQMRAELNQ